MVHVAKHYILRVPKVRHMGTTLDGKCVPHAYMDSLRKDHHLTHDAKDRKGHKAVPPCCYLYLYIYMYMFTYCRHSYSCSYAYQRQALPAQIPEPKPQNPKPPKTHYTRLLNPLKPILRRLVILVFHYPNITPMPGF